MPMKFLNQLYAWGLSILTLLLQSCNCNCTEIGCISDSKPYTLQFPSQEFTQEDLTEVHFIRVNDSYEKIDLFRNYLKSIGFIDLVYHLKFN